MSDKYCPERLVGYKMKSDGLCINCEREDFINCETYRILDIFDKNEQIGSTTQNER